MMNRYSPLNTSTLTLIGGQEESSLTRSGEKQQTGSSQFQLPYPLSRRNQEMRRSALLPETPMNNLASRSPFGGREDNSVLSRCGSHTASSFAADLSDEQIVSQ
jgi:hypothetical protein